MTTKPVSLRPPVYGWKDLCRVTGLGRDAVKAAIRCGELPGVVVGDQPGRRPRYIVPAEAFDAFCRGEWQPHPRLVSATPIRPLVARRKVS